MVLGLAWLGVVVFTEGLLAQTPAGVCQFEVGRVVLGHGDWNPVRGVMTVGGETFRYDSNDENYSFEGQIGDISEIKRWPKRFGVSEMFIVKLANGKGYTYRFCVLNEKHRCGAPVEPVIAALTAAIKSPSAPPPPSAQMPPPRKPNFAPIPPPQAPVDAPADPARVVVGQTPNQVKAALGPPDRIVLSPSPAVAQAPDQTRQFELGLMLAGPDLRKEEITELSFERGALRGVMTLTASAVRYESDRYSFEAQVDDISGIKRGGKDFTLRLKSGRFYGFCVLTEKHKCGSPVGPVIEALTAVMSGKPGPQPVP
jgi:hypothetical protein